MDQFIQYTPTEVVFGKETENQAGAEVKKWGGTKVLVVYGGGSAKRSGLLDRVEASLAKEGLAFEELGGVKPNPRLALAEEGVKKAVEMQADFILAVGGGSSIDTAKAVAHGAANPEEALWDIWTKKVPLTKSLPVGAVLTIPAAGSEMSDSAVLTNEAIGKKAGINTPFNRCKFAIMNPELAATLPKYQIACGVTDIMMHTMERYFIPESQCEMTDEIAEGLLRTVIKNGPKVGVEITDLGMEGEPESVKAYYEGAATMGEIAKKAAAMEGADFLCLRLAGGDPNGLNKSVEELIETVKEVADAVDVPLVVEGCKNVEKDSELLTKVAEVLQGRNVLVMSAREEDYKAVGAAAGLAYSQKVGAESAVDINLAKQLNVVMTQLGVSADSIVMNVGSAAVGYGYEYVVSTLDRIKAAALSQDDKMLQMPIITPIASETWNVKEAMATEEESPEWGNQEVRGVSMEIQTAAASLASGSDAVILKHPQSVATISKMIQELM